MAASHTVMCGFLQVVTFGSISHCDVWHGPHCDVWVLATWNVRTLLDVDGSLETARHVHEVADERKVMDELRRYEVDTAAF